MSHEILSKNSENNLFKECLGGLYILVKRGQKDAQKNK